MAESDEILLISLRDSGIRIPCEAPLIGDLESEALISICTQSLNLIGDTAQFPTSVPDSSSVAEQVEFCTEMASAIKNLGYLADISSHQFLYPSEEESSKLIGFLVEKIKESGEIGRNELGKSLNDGKEDDAVEDGNKIQTLTNEVLGSESNSSEEKLIVKAIRKEEFSIEREYGTLLDSVKIINPPKDQSSKMKYETQTSETEHLEEELTLLNEAVELAFDDQHSIGFHLNQLTEKVQAKTLHLQELNSQWEDLRKPLEDEKKNLQRSLYAHSPKNEEKFQRLKEVESETRTILSKIDKSKTELHKLSQELEKQPKAASRKSHIDRVKEITKNSRRQDADIERILKDTRDLQLESNSIQERLHRTYAVADEMIFREAKKDPVGRQAYRLLTSIHECFEQISEKIMAVDRVRREVTEREKKLSSMASRSLKLEKDRGRDEKAKNLL